MKKLEALKYLVENERYYDEWSGAGMYHALFQVIKSEEEEFDREFLDQLLDEAENF